MSIIKKSTVKGFEGEVTFFQPLVLEQVFAFEDAQDNAAQDEETSSFLTKINMLQGAKNEAGEVVKGRWSSHTAKFFLPAILKCVEAWNVPTLPQPLTVDNFPLTPRGETQEFILWCFHQIELIYSGETEIPNES